MRSEEFSVGSASGCLPRARVPQAAALLVFAGCMSPFPASAQWTHQAAIEGRLTATDDVANAAGAARADVSASIRPSLQIAGRGPNFNLSLNAAADLVSYARGTESDRILPLVEGGLKSVLVERLLYFDANVNVRQTEADAFGPSNDASSTSNRRNSASYRLSPYLLYEFSPRISVLARHDESQSRQSGADATNLRSHYSVARLVGKPVPLGFSLEVSNLQNDFSGASTSELRMSAAKAGVSIGVFDEFVFGAAAGVERTRLLLSDQEDRLYGVNLRWVPTPRTELFGNLEQRFFGKGGELRLTHRTPSTAFSLRASREPVTAASSFGVIGAGGDIRGFLDAILSRTTPDPVQRAAIVQNLIVSRGLQTSLSNAVDVVATYPQLQTGLNASWVYLGQRVTTSLSAFRQNLRQLTQTGAVALPPSLVTADSRQTGAGIEVNYRLAPQTSVDGALRWSRIRGLAATDGQSTSERSVRVSLVHNLSPRTGLSAGLQYTIVDSNVGSGQTQKPALAFAGMSHRF
jgi:uncharacterized protein (PEP-CTERM system associated)